MGHSAEKLARIIDKAEKTLSQMKDVLEKFGDDMTASTVTSKLVEAKIAAAEKEMAGLAKVNAAGDERIDAMLASLETHRVSLRHVLAINTAWAIGTSRLDKAAGKGAAKTTTSESQSESERKTVGDSMILAIKAGVAQGLQVPDALYSRCLGFALSEVHDSNDNFIQVLQVNGCDADVTDVPLTLKDIPPAIRMPALRCAVMSFIHDIMRVQGSDEQVNVLSRITSALDTPEVLLDKEFRGDVSALSVVCKYDTMEMAQVVAPTMRPCHPRLHPTSSKRSSVAATAQRRRWTGRAN